MQIFALIQGGYDIIIYKVLYFMSMKHRHCSCSIMHVFYTPQHTLQTAGVNQILVVQDMDVSNSDLMCPTVTPLQAV